MDLSDEVQELVWALVDDAATDEQVRRLEELLLENQEARQIYVTCMQMHADLQCLLGAKPPKLTAPGGKPTTPTHRAAKPRPPLPIVELPTPPASVPLFGPM
ncbi:MAG: hypothetical protein ABFC96_18945 [Thermoguttaceae bacterium]